MLFWGLLVSGIRANAVAVGASGATTDEVILVTGAAGQIVSPGQLSEPRPSVASKIYSSWCGDLKQRQAIMSHRQYMRLTVTAGLFMAGVRSMLATVSFVYSGYFCISAFWIGFLTAIPTACGIASSMLAGSLARKHTTGL